jgi:RNA polymerase sigma factor (sigma-70 family)
MSTLTPPGAPWTGSLPAAAPAADEELVRRMRRGDQRAFEAIYERYRLPLHRYCHSIVRQREDAEEAFQATMLAAFRSLSAGEGREIALRPWLYRIAHNECVSTLRRRRRHEADELSGLEAASDDVAGRSELAEDLRQLQADLARLSEAQRSALVMRELGGLAHAEIGRALGREADSVKQLIYEARMSLHALAEGRELACESVRRTLSDGDGRALRGRALRAHLRACGGCRDFQKAMRGRPVRLSLIAPALPAALLHELLATVAGGAGGGTLAGGGVAAGAGGAAALGGGTAMTAVGGGLGAKLVAVGAVALVGGTAAGVPAIEAAVRPPAAPATGAIPALVRVAAAEPAPSAATRSAAAPVAAAARGARTRLAPAGASAAAPASSAPAPVPTNPRPSPGGMRRATPSRPEVAVGPSMAGPRAVVPAAPARRAVAPERPAQGGRPAPAPPAEGPAEAAGRPAPAGAAQPPALIALPEGRPGRAPEAPAPAAAPPATELPLPVAPAEPSPGGPPAGAGAPRER